MRPRVRPVADFPKASPLSEDLPTSNTITVSSQLRRPHRFVAATREATRGLKPAADGRLHFNPRPGLIAMTVSREQLNRALRIAQALFREAERRGCGVEPLERGYDARPGVAIVVRAHRYPITIAEETDQVPMSDADRARWREENRWKLRWEPGA